MLVGPIIVAGNGTGTDIDTLPDMGITEIAQVAGLGVSIEAAIFDLDKITNTHTLAKLGARAQTGKGPYLSLLLQLSAINVGKGVNTYASLEPGITQITMRTHIHPITQMHLTLKNTAYINKNIAATM